MLPMTIERAYGIAGLAIALVIGVISADLLTGGLISAAFGRAPARLAAVPDSTDQDGVA